MGLLHRRRLLIRFPRVPSIAGALALATALACGGAEEPVDTPPAAAGDTFPPAPAAEPADTTASDVTLLREIPDGAPMPDAGRAGGIAPYPGATVYTRLPRERPGLRSFEAFTPDSWETVQAYFDTTLGPQWVKIDAKDTKVYEKGNDEAAITVTPWDPEDLPAGVEHPPVLREARTVIGAAWRTD